MLLLPLILALHSASESTLEPPPVFAPAPAYALPAAPPASRTLQSEGFELSYTFIDITYFSTDVDAIDERTDAFGARASLGLFDMLYVFLDYAREDLDFDGGSVESDMFGLGAGIHKDLTSKLDFVAEASWVYDDLNSDTFDDLDDSNSGWTAFVGGRGLAISTARGGLEINGGFRWIDREALLSDDKIAAWELGGRFHFADHFSVGATYQFLEDDSRWSAGARFSF